MGLEDIDRIRAALAELDAAIDGARGKVTPAELAAALREPEPEVLRWFRRCTPPHVSVTDAAERLGTSRTAVYRLIERGELEFADAHAPASGVTLESLESLAETYSRRLSLSAAAEELGVDRGTIRRLMDTGQLTALEAAGRSYIDKAAIEAYQKDRFPAGEALPLSEAAEQLGVTVPTVRERARRRGIRLVELYSGRAGVRVEDVELLA